MRHLIVPAGYSTVSSIQRLQPDTVIYVVPRASTVGDLAPAIIAEKTELPISRFRIVILSDAALADVKRCYDQLLIELQQLQQPEDTYLVDYHAARPALASALALVALHFDNYQLLNLTSEGPGVMDAADKRALTASVHSDLVLTAEKAAFIDALVHKYHYGPAAEYLRSLLRYTGWKREAVTELNNLLIGFDAWDKFRYADALTRLNPTRLRDTYAPMLRRLTGDLKGNGFEAVFDLLLSAEREAVRGWYDDAALRVYRAVEVFAFCYLKKVHKQDANDLALAKLPPALQAKYAVYAFDDGSVKIGALQCYELLTDLNDAFIGPIYRTAKDKLVAKVLRARNESKLGYGEPSITAEQYQAMRGYADDFLERSAAAIGLRNDFVQFPDSLNVGDFFS